MLLASSSAGEKLPIRALGIADGLASINVNSISRDARGFLWFGTNEGLSIYDGREFITYGHANGLPRDNVSDVLQTRDGDYWVATSDGICELDPNAPSGHKCRAYGNPDAGARRANVLCETRSGELWYGAEGGLFHLVRSGSRSERHFERVPILPASGQPAADQRVISLYEDSRGDLWVGTFRALYRRTPAGRVTEYRLEPVTDMWNAVFEDGGGLWAGTGTGLWRLLPDGRGDYRLRPAFVPEHRVIVWCITRAPGNSLWLGSSTGLIEWTPLRGGKTGRARVYTEANGLTHNEVTALATDREGNLWMGTSGGGAMQLAKNGFTTYTGTDGLTFQYDTTPTLFRDRTGEVGVAFHHVLNILRANRFKKVVPRLPEGLRYLGWGWHQTILQDHLGEWWIATGEGLARYPSVAVDALGRTRPKAVYTTRDGLRTNEVFRVFEDRRGDVWIGSIGPPGINGLSRWRRDTNSFDHFPVHPEGVPSAFAADDQGNVWIGYYDGALAWFRGGSFRYYGPGDGLAGGTIHAVHIDKAGRLWIASSRGLTRADYSQGSPRFSRYGVEQGLASNVVLCATEDARGRVYLATGRGIDRIGADGIVAPGRVMHYNVTDGLTRGDLRDVLVDRSEVLWCASKQGISRFVPDFEPPVAAPPVFIRGIRVRGSPYRNWDAGETAVPSLTFAADQNQLQMDFAGLSFDPGSTVRYQYKLDSIDPDWSQPTDQRSVTYSQVAPGRYRFSVRLMTGEGTVSEHPASLDFVVLAPLWRRTWFEAALLIVAALLFYTLHRYRTARILEVERVRTRIATDLHDEIGSGLSQIAILSEVARARANGQRSTADMLSNIGSVARELVSSMSDIVWTVDARRDHLGDLVQRMRRFATDVLTGNNIDLHFGAPLGSGFHMHMATETRREVYLVFKEAVNNAVRHARCTRVDVDVSVDERALVVTIQDNGKGLPEPVVTDGNGLSSMRERALRMRGTIEFNRGSMGGLEVRLRIPALRRAYLSASRYLHR